MSGRVARAAIRLAYPSRFAIAPCSNSPKLVGIRSCIYMRDPELAYHLPSRNVRLQTISSLSPIRSFYAGVSFKDTADWLTSQRDGAT